MKRMFLLFGLLLSGVAPPLDATSIDCVPNVGCSEDMKPPQCCKRPPCEFFQALREAKAKRNILAKNRQRMALALLDEDDGFRAFRQQFSEDLKRARSRFSKCPENHFYQKPPILMALQSTECRIEGSVKGEIREVSLDDAQEASNSCSELVDAEYASAEKMQFYCNMWDGKGSSKNIAFQWQSEAQAEVDSLQAALQQFWSRCSDVADAKTARKVAAAGIDTLKKTPPKKPPKKQGPSKNSRNSGKGAT